MDLEPAHDQPPASLAAFISALTTSGEVSVSSAGLNAEEDRDALAVLVDLEEQTRDDLAATAPVFDLSIAIWAARQFYHGCRFLICREVPAAEVTRQLIAPCPRPRAPATDYSVDLVFRYLPDLLNFAERSASDDALTIALREWAHVWPLSSVGARVAGPFNIDPFVGSPALLQLYADRIVRHSAVDRLNDPRVLARVRAVIGAYPDLAPGLASKLNPALSPSCLP